MLTLSGIKKYIRLSFVEGLKYKYVFSIRFAMLVDE